MLSQFEIAGIDIDASIVVENGLCFHINGFNKNVVLSSSVCFGNILLLLLSVCFGSILLAFLGSILLAFLGSILLLIFFHVSELKILETKHFGMLLALPWKILRLVSTQIIKLTVSRNLHQAIGFVQDVLVLDDAAFHLRHTAHDAHHLLLVFEAERFIYRDARGLTHEADVALGIVAIRTWCPSGDDLADGVGMVFHHVGADEHEGCTIAKLATLELHEGFVGLQLFHSKPLVLAVADVERVVVADATSGIIHLLAVIGGSALNCFLCCHNFFC